MVLKLGMVVRKLLNMRKKQTDYNADEEEDDLNSSSTDSDTEGLISTLLLSFVFDLALHP